MNSAKYMKYVRTQLGLSQKEMAERMGFTDGSYVGKVERGEYNLSRTARKLLEMIEEQEGNDEQSK